MKSRRRYMCGVPFHACCGSVCMSPLRTDAGLKVHNTTVEAFNCKARYLISQGYERVGSREFAAPNGGPIHVLTKKSRFGGELIGGKRGIGGKDTASKATGAMGKRMAFNPRKGTGGIIFAS